MVTLRVGIIGAGGMGRVHAQSYRKAPDQAAQVPTTAAAQSHHHPSILLRLVEQEDRGNLSEGIRLIWCSRTAFSGSTRRRDGSFADRAILRQF